MMDTISTNVVETDEFLCFYFILLTFMMFYIPCTSSIMLYISDYCHVNILYKLYNYLSIFSSEKQILHAVITDKNDNAMAVMQFTVL